ncbi:MAG: S8/S53 family peptidase [Bacteroidota bacterium]
MKYGRVFLSICFILLSTVNLLAQQINSSAFRKDKLRELWQALNLKKSKSYDRAHNQAEKKGWETHRKSPRGTSTVLVGLDTLGFPIYLQTCDDNISAITTATNTVQPGGALGLNLSGSSTFLSNKLAIWDEGIVFSAHNEFAGKTIKVPDGATNVLDHVTHVAGTLFAKGVLPQVKGMAFGLTTLQSYDFINDQAEMALAADRLLISNHSYGYEAGWSFNNVQNRWEWNGLPGDTVDYKFGFYSDDAMVYDEIAFNAPEYLIVQAAGNSHGETGPTVGNTYYGYASKTDPTMVNKGPFTGDISSNNGYDVISGTANAKNILTVGAVNPSPTGPITSTVQIAPFSSWGPTDDGRIKPDICGNGVNVLSTGRGAPNAYFSTSGTSAATPNVSGSLFLLQEYYALKNSGNFMRSATLKGLACHTAYDAGNPGPDYIYGWGLLNMSRAAQTITDNGSKSLINEETLANGLVQTYTMEATNNEPLMATLTWTDPKGEPTVYGVVNDHALKLVNDLDLRFTDGSATYSPWVLNPAKPAKNATTGDNIRDNIEQVYIANPIAGKTYTLTVSHKGKLTNGLQNYSLIVTGIQTAQFNGPATNNLYLKVFPTPASSYINIVFNALTKNILTIELYNAIGQKVYNSVKQVSQGAYTTTLNTEDLINGLYYMRLQLGDKIYLRTVPIIK